MKITAYSLAQRFVGLKEVPGISVNNAQILAMLRLDQVWPTSDEVPWCSAFINYVCWLLRLPRSKSLAARSWLDVGIPIELMNARPTYDIVVLSRNSGGHVGFFASSDSSKKLVYLLGGNQSDSVSITSFDVERILGVRRLADPNS